jgi:hypothetical protein
MIVKIKPVGAALTALKAANAGQPIYPEKIAPQRFHVAFDGTVWQCFQNEEGDKTDNIAGTKMAVKFSADWDGVSPYVINVVGTWPTEGIPFLGWPNTDVVPIGV